MAWNEHYIVPFKTKEGNDLAVKIYEQDYTGSVMTLTGSDEPFTTQEDDDDNSFTPVRGQSGYLRVIDATGTLMEQLMPDNNTEKMVRLWSGTYSGGTFTEGAVCWQGFLQAQAYTQPWLDGTVELEFPVKSLLGALEDIPLSTEFAFAYKPIVFILYQMFNLLGVTPDSVTLISDLRSENTYFLDIYMSLSIFFNKKDIMNESTIVTEHIGDSLLDVATEIMKLYGFTMREDGDKVYIAQYDYEGSRTRIFLWSEIEGMALDDSSYLRRNGTFDMATMMSSLTFKKNDTEQSFVPGSNSVEVNLQIESSLPPLAEIPTTDEDASTPQDINVIDMEGGVQPPVVIQWHEPRTGGVETFAYWKMIEKYGRYENVEFGDDYVAYLNSTASDYATFWANLMLRSNRFDNRWPYLVIPPVEYDFYTGAMPVRYGQGSDNTQAILQSGILLVQGSANLGHSGSSIPDNKIYSIRSEFNADVESGYLNIDMKLKCFFNRTEEGNTGVFVSPGIWRMYVAFRIGSQYWNGSAWSSDSTSKFWMHFSGENIQTNKDSSMNVEKASGWFIPIASAMTGEVEFTFYDGVVTQQGHWGIVGSVVHKILTDFSVEQLLTRDVVNSTRGSNTYRKTILSRGFRDETTVDLKVGTKNNNPVSTSFIRNRLGVYRETFDYYTGQDPVSERPEIHLLDRMAKQVNKVKHIYEATVQRGMELMHTLYTKDDKTYFGIKAQTNWRDDTEQVKFIEVTQTETVEDSQEVSGIEESTEPITNEQQEE
jgi:hypothetical protein